jgi:hypothetical protein
MYEEIAVFIWGLCSLFLLSVCARRLKCIMDDLEEIRDELKDD